MFATLALVSILASPVRAQGPVQPTFTYQGRLLDGGAVANGIYDFEFKLYDAPSGPVQNQIGVTVTANNVGVIDGVVTIELAFGAGSFNGGARWLEIGVRPGISTGAYTALTPRQAITAAPYSMFALDIPGGRIPSGAVMYFNLPACPTGWTELSRAQGRYIVGRRPGGTLADTVGTALFDRENRPVGQHTHTITDPGHQHGYEQAFPNSTSSGNSQAGYRHALTDVAVTGITINPEGTTPGTNAPYIILLICQKD
jgi:hypothetical protein